MLASKHDMKHLLLTTIAAVLLVGCATTGQITEKQSIAALQDLFKALDVDKYNRNDFGLLITDDFQIFEKRKKCRSMNSLISLIVLILDQLSLLIGSCLILSYLLTNNLLTLVI